MAAQRDILSPPLGGPWRRSTRQLHLWMHPPRPSLPFQANFGRVTSYGCGSPVGVIGHHGVCATYKNYCASKGKVEDYAENSRQSTLEIVRLGAVQNSGGNLRHDSIL